MSLKYYFEWRKIQKSKGLKPHYTEWRKIQKTKRQLGNELYVVINDETTDTVFSTYDKSLAFWIARRKKNLTAYSLFEVMRIKRE